MRGALACGLLLHRVHQHERGRRRQHGDEDAHRREYDGKQRVAVRRVPNLHGSCVVV